MTTCLLLIISARYLAERRTAQSDPSDVDYRHGSQPQWGEARFARRLWAIRDDLSGRFECPTEGHLRLNRLCQPPFPFSIPDSWLKSSRSSTPAGRARSTGRHDRIHGTIEFTARMVCRICCDEGPGWHPGRERSSARPCQDLLRLWNTKFSPDFLCRLACSVWKEWKVFVWFRGL